MASDASFPEARRIARGTATFDDQTVRFQARRSQTGHHGKMLFMESASVRARAATWKAGSGSVLELFITANSSPSRSPRKSLVSGRSHLQPEVVVAVEARRRHQRGEAVVQLE